jgi:hypothetical protein
MAGSFMQSLVNKRLQSMVNKSKKSKRKGGQAKQTQRGNPLVSLGSEAANYARSLLNPYTGALPTIPSLPAMLTRRARVFSRGTFSTQGNLLGFISMNPQGALVSDDANGYIVATSGAGAFGTFPPFLAAGTNSVNSNSEYVTASIGPNLIQGRVVASGLRVRYIGTMLNTGGQMTALHEPNHNSLQGLAFANVTNYVEGRLINIRADQSYEICYKPVRDTDDDMGGVSPAQGVGTNTYYMGFAIQSAVANSAFEYEAFTCLEFIGSNIRDKTLSVADLAGHSAVQTAMVHDIGTKMTTGDSGDKANAMVHLATAHLQNSSTVKPVSQSSTDWGSVAKTATSLASGALSALDWGDLAGSVASFFV